MLIRWTEPAVHDLTNICDYIDEANGRASARKVALKILR
jgi:plasmid stabilization system protein ParE